MLPDAVELVSEPKVLVFLSAECAGGGGRDTREGPVLVRRRSGKGDFIPVAIWWISGGVGGLGLSISYTNDVGGAVGCCNARVSVIQTQTSERASSHRGMDSKESRRTGRVFLRLRVLFMLNNSLLAAPAVGERSSADPTIMSRLPIGTGSARDVTWWV